MTGMWRDAIDYAEYSGEGWWDEPLPDEEPVPVPPPPPLVPDVPDEEVPF